MCEFYSRSSKRRFLGGSNSFACEYSPIQLVACMQPSRGLPPVRQRMADDEDQKKRKTIAKLRQLGGPARSSLVENIRRAKRRLTLAQADEQRAGWRSTRENRSLRLATTRASPAVWFRCAILRSHSTADGCHPNWWSQNAQHLRGLLPHGNVTVH